MTVKPEEVAELLESAADAHDAEYGDNGCLSSGLLRGLAASVRAAHGGPAQVATRAYRDGWETLFGKKVQPGSA